MQSSIITFLLLSLLQVNEASYSTTVKYDPSFQPLEWCRIPLTQHKNYAFVANQVYDGGKNCGACIKITNGAKSTIAHVVDNYRTGRLFDLYLSNSTLSELGYKDTPINVSYDLVKCNVLGNVKYNWEKGANEYFARVSIQNSKVPIKSVELSKDGKVWNHLPYSGYDRYVIQNTAGPYKFRIKSSDCQTVIDEVTPDVDGNIIEGKVQFK